MSKLEQILIIEPASVLRFKGPFTNVCVVTADVTLKNPSERRVCFKVQTTAPRRYCVRPNCGVVEAGAHVTLTITLQPFDDRVADERSDNKDKFAVRSVVVPPGVSDADPALWADAADRGDIMETRLRCVFEPPSENDRTTRAVPATDSTDDGDTAAPSRDLAGAKLSCVFELPSERAKKRVADATDDAAPSAAVAPTEPHGGSLDDTEVKKLREKCERLRAEIGDMAEENRRLKDEALGTRGGGRTALSDHRDASSNPCARAEDGSLSLASFLIVVSAVYIGLFLGKFML